MDTMSDRRLERDFFSRDARVVARALLGCTLVHEPDLRGGRRRMARIVETEAYRGPTDLACHARAGLTPRTRTLLGVPGHAYVYFVYGMHELFNVTCLREGAGHAVLVRAAEAVSGLEDDARLDGPGRLTRAMGITRTLDGEDLVEGRRVHLLPRSPGARVRVGVSARVGVGYAGRWADEPWRFFDRDSASVSRPPRSAIGRERPA
jgi:DNA-3-methyladenine glycosylase